MEVCVCVCVCVCVRMCGKKFCEGDRQEIKMRLTSFKSGAGFYMHTLSREAFLLADKVYAGVQGQSRHTRMIDGSVWMLKSTEHEHVSAAQPRPSTQHLFKGQVLQNTLTEQLLPLSYQSRSWEVNTAGKSPLRFENYGVHDISVVRLKD